MENLDLLNTELAAWQHALPTPTNGKSTGTSPPKTPAPDSATCTQNIRSDGLLVTAAFTMFVADYAERRSHLIGASRELNMTEPGRLAATNLGREVARESAVVTVVAGVASLVGAAAPLLLGALLPVPPAVTLAISIGLLGLLGWAIASMPSANRLRWCVAMLIGGALVAIISGFLDIV